MLYINIFQILRKKYFLPKKIFSKIQKIHQIYRYLYDDVEGYVEVSAVYEHVGDEAPDLLLGVRVEDEGAAQVDRAVGAHGVALVGQQDHVVHEHADLAQAHLYTAVTYKHSGREKYKRKCS